MAIRMAMPTLPACTAVSSVLSDALSRSPAVTPSDAAMNPDTASATSMTRAHHHKDVAAATRARTRRGTISRQPACLVPRCSAMMKLRPIQPRITMSAPEAMAQTTIQASLTRGCR